jgi:hypothetical protein
MDVKTLAQFRLDVVNLYRKFEYELAALCQKYGFKVNMWYSPSKIPQPNIKVDGFLLDIDQLYDEDEFKQFVDRFSENRANINIFPEKLGSSSLENFTFDNELNKGINVRCNDLRKIYDGVVLDFKYVDGDFRRKRMSH